MGDAHRVVPVEDAGPVPVVDPADAYHAEFIEFGRTQGADAGGPEHRDSPRHGVEDFFVPHRQAVVVDPVDDNDDVSGSDFVREEVTVPNGPVPD
ncbi:hypothetical protein GCM10018779_53080 [Streptomyces griseocarneus]|nr:hypothetical protein GCM10018779_53080 [Streptomyces griseocarneus]